MFADRQGKMGLGRILVRTFADFALPPRCPVCGVTVEENHEFCLMCWQQLEFLAGPCCIQCGEPFAFERSPESKCGQCLAKPPHLDGVHAVVRYGDVSAKIIIRLKYGGRLGIAELIAGHLHRLVAEGDPADMIVPVPLHRSRLWSRGFNQSVLIAEALGRRMARDVSHNLLIRKRPTPPLKKMNNAERFQTVKDVFDVTAKGRSLLSGKKIVLVDDVYTSGSTANACARILKAGGAQKVTLLCWARVCHSVE